MPLPDVAFLLVAGMVAGVIGTAGGITSLVSYPALLAVGLPAYEANVANLVAGVACWPASALVSRPELRAVRAHLPAGMAAAAAGAAAGSGLLLVTGSDLFRQLVPFLVAAGSCVLLAAPRLTSWYPKAGGDRARSATFAVALISVYGGYFGAGSGGHAAGGNACADESPDSGGQRLEEHVSGCRRRRLGADSDYGGTGSLDQRRGPGRRIARGQSCRPPPRSATAGGDPSLGRGNPRLCARRHPLR